MSCLKDWKREITPLHSPLTSQARERPVAVTGIGMICPLGTSTGECWENLLGGRSGIREITKFDTNDCTTRIGGQLPEKYFELEKQNTPKRLRKQTVLATRILRLCAQEGIGESGLDMGKEDPYRCAAIIGTSGSSVRSPSDLGEAGTERFKIIREMINALPAWISMDYGFKGPTFTVSAACASGAYAISQAFDLIQAGSVDIAIAGGVDTLLTKNSIRRGNFMKMLSEQNRVPEKAMRPFDRKRDGWVLSDGGCAVVLESHDHAVRRNARVYAWMLGHGSLSESYSLYAPSPYGEGMIHTMESALKSGRVPGEKVGYVCANGTSTVVNDYYETIAIKKVFGKHANDLFISAPKSMVGHCIGGASAISFAVTALALRTQKIPPTINYEFPDPDCDLNYVPNAMIEANGLEIAISNSFGFGGHNCVVVLKRSL